VRLAAAFAALLITLSAAQSIDQLLKQAAQLRDQHRLAESLEVLRQAAKLEPGRAGVHREIGLILLEQREFKAAATEFQTAWQLQPGDWDSRYNQAMSLANAGDRESAMAILQALTKSRPNWALAWFGIGHVQAERNHTAEAEKAFREALRVDPKLYRAQFELARLLDRKGETQTAIAAYRAALKLKPDTPAPRYRLAALLRQSGDAQGAAAELKTVQQLIQQRQSGERAAAAYLRGVDRLNQGDGEGAVKELQLARQERPDFDEIEPALAAAWIEWATAAEQARRFPEAVERFREALKLEPDPEVENHVGVLLARMGKIQEAAASFQRALDLRPGYESAQKNLRQARGILSSPGEVR
jgi:superkiller protein 3